MKSVKCENNEYYRLQNLPYEKFMAHGARALTDSELLAVILRTGTKGVSACRLGERVLEETSKRGNGLLGLHQISLHDLMQIEGIGEVKAVKLKAIAEISTRIAQAGAKKALCYRTPHTIAEYYMERFRHENVEYVLLIMLDAGLHPLGEQTLSKGSVNASILSPREVFLEALKVQAAGVMLLHNHPGGSPMPSENDIRVTKRITEAGALMDIPLLDHIIIGDNSYFSFRESGLFTDEQDFPDHMADAAIERKG